MLHTLFNPLATRCFSLGHPLAICLIPLSVIESHQDTSICDKVQHPSLKYQIKSMIQCNMCSLMKRTHHAGLLITQKYS